MNKQMQTAIFLQDKETSELNENYIKILEKCFSLIEMESFQPSHIMLAGIHLFNVYHPELKINEEKIKTIGATCDERKKASGEKILNTAEIHKNSKSNLQILSANNLIRYLETTKPFYSIIVIRKLLTHKSLLSDRTQMLAALKDFESQQEQRKRLFDMLAAQLKDGKKLNELIKQRLFESLVAEAQMLAKRIDSKKYNDKKELISEYYFKLRGEESQSEEMLFLRILFICVKNPEYKTYLQELYKKWPNKDERKETILILKNISSKFHL